MRLVIAGNHDFALNTPTFKILTNDNPELVEGGQVKQDFGDFEEARSLLQDDPDIAFLEEGVHRFVLANSVLLTVYASPYTPSKSNWGFKYHPDQGHNSDTPRVDLVMTHGPPRGVLDRTDSKERAGCPQLLSAIARARPRLHCFGHIYEGWGAKLVTWRKETSGTSTHFTATDNDKSVTLPLLSSLKAGKLDTSGTVEKKKLRLEHLMSQWAFFMSHCARDEMPLCTAEQILIINTSIKGPDESSLQLPWVVDIDLTKA